MCRFFVLCFAFACFTFCTVSVLLVVCLNNFIIYNNYYSIINIIYQFLIACTFTNISASMFLFTFLFICISLFCFFSSSPKLTQVLCSGDHQWAGNWLNVYYWEFQRQPREEPEMTLRDAFGSAVTTPSSSTTSGRVIMPTNVSVSLSLYFLLWKLKLERYLPHRATEQLRLIIRPFG